MDEINRVETNVFNVSSVKETMAPPPPPEEETKEVRVLKAGENVPLGNIKFKPINNSYSKALTSPLEIMQRRGYGNPIKNVNEYLKNSMFRVGNFINITS